MDSQIFIVGAVRGLVSEGERVFSIIKDTMPTVIGLSISKEGMMVMKDHSNFEAVDIEAANVEEEVYISGLSEFGDVVKPPPCFSRAIAAANQFKIPLEALDMDDEHYTAAYCKYISTFDMMRQGRSGPLFSSHVFHAKSPEEFVIEWDGLINRLKGYKELEMAKEEWFAKGVCRLAKKHEKILVIIEVERLSGMCGYLKTMECDHKILY